MCAMCVYIDKGYMNTDIILQWVFNRLKSLLTWLNAISILFGFILALSLTLSVSLSEFRDTLALADAIRHDNKRKTGKKFSTHQKHKTNAIRDDNQGPARQPVAQIFYDERLT